MWEVVRIQNPDDTLSVLTSLTQVDKYDEEFIHQHACHPVHLDLIGCVEKMKILQLESLYLPSAIIICVGDTGQCRDRKRLI